MFTKHPFPLPTQQTWSHCHKIQANVSWKVHNLELWTNHWGLLTCAKSVNVKSGKCVVRLHSSGEPPILEGHNFHVT